MEMQIKMTLRYHFFYLSERLRSKILMTVYVGEDMELEEHSSTARGSANLYISFGNHYGGFLENWESTYLKIQICKF